MAEMKCFGYYLAKPIPRPDWCTLGSSHILSVSEDDVGCKFPDLTKCFWINYPQSDRDRYAEYLGLDKNEFSELCDFVCKLFNQKRISTDVRFPFYEDALAMSRYLRNVSGFRVVGLFTDSKIFSEFEAEDTFGVIPAGDDHGGGKIIGYDILGCESMSGGYYCFDSYIENSLHEVIGQNAKLLVDGNTGLILNTYEETKGFCDIIQGMGEPVIWTPFELREYDAGLI